MKNTGLAPALALLVLASCGGDDDDGLSITPGPRESACRAETLVGTFQVILDDGFTSVQGKVESHPTPLRFAETLESDGDCALMGPPELFCDPACASGTVCGLNGQCGDEPLGISVGTVRIEGLSDPVEMTASSPVFFYSHRGTLAHPGFEESDDIVLTAAGEGDVDAFALGGRGVAALQSDLQSVELAESQAVALTWQAPADADAGTIYIELNIAQHGGTPGWIECEVADTGSFTIPIALTDALISRGFSGFPALTIERRSTDSEEISAGCVQLLLQSPLSLAVMIPGLTSCSDTSDCEGEETCQPDLTCG
tara:strand:+ start:24050 stop:24985 length:936 start_codon:yes stop_codon:yes gene_type:complete